MSASTRPIIQIRDVHKHFPGGVHALRGVSLDVAAGEVVVIIGPSGSGKSTLLRCINRLEAIDSGSIVVDGIPLTDKAADINKIRAEVGMVFQLFNLFSHLTALENITLAQRVVRKRSEKEAREIAMELLRKVGIPDKANVYPDKLSGGQQQRVAIARALANRPELIIADEPTGELDSVTGRQILELFRQIVDSEGVTLIMATHDPTVEDYADVIYELVDGQVVEARDMRTYLSALR